MNKVQSPFGALCCLVAPVLPSNGKAISAKPTRYAVLQLPGANWRTAIRIRLACARLFFLCGKELALACGVGERSGMYRGGDR